MGFTQWSAELVEVVRKRNGKDTLREKSMEPDGFEQLKKFCYSFWHLRAWGQES